MKLFNLNDIAVALEAAGWPPDMVSVVDGELRILPVPYLHGTQRLALVPPARREALEQSGRSVAQIAVELGVGMDTVYKAGWKSRRPGEPAAFAPREPLTRYPTTDARLAELTERFRLYLEACPDTMPTMARFAVWAREQGLDARNAQTHYVTLRMNGVTFVQFLRDLGVPPAKFKYRPTTRRPDAVTGPDARAAMTKFVTHCLAENVAPSIKAYSRWRVTVVPVPPSPSTMWRACEMRGWAELVNSVIADLETKNA